MLEVVHNAKHEICMTSSTRVCMTISMRVYMSSMRAHAHALTFGIVHDLKHEGVYVLLTQVVYHPL